jgi:hypothetical protein
MAPTTKKTGLLKDFEVFTAVKIHIVIFWVMTPCTLVGRYQSFGGTYCLHLQCGRRRQCIPPKRWYPPTRLLGSTTKKKHNMVVNWEIQKDQTIFNKYSVKYAPVGPGLIHDYATTTIWFRLLAGFTTEGTVVPLDFLHTPEKYREGGHTYKPPARFNPRF